MNGTFPLEIDGRIHPLQISKEYTTSAEYKAIVGSLDAATRQHKEAMLETAISVKTQEVSYLQQQFSEAGYINDATLIYSEVIEQLASDAALGPNAEGGYSMTTMPGSG